MNPVNSGFSPLTSGPSTPKLQLIRVKGENQKNIRFHLIFDPKYQEIFLDVIPTKSNFSNWVSTRFSSDYVKLGELGYLSVKAVAKTFGVTHERAKESIKQQSIENLFQEKVTQTAEQERKQFRRKAKKLVSYQNTIPESLPKEEAEHNLRQWNAYFLKRILDQNTRTRWLNPSRYPIYSKYQMTREGLLLLDKGKWAPSGLTAELLLSALDEQEKLEKSSNPLLSSPLGVSSVINGRLLFFKKLHPDGPTQIFHLFFDVLLGVGGTGRVYQGVSITQASYIAAKTALDKMNIDAEQAVECQVMATKGEFCTTVVMNDGTLFRIEELMDGSIYDLVVKGDPSIDKYSLQRRINICYQILEGYRRDYFNNGILHRDIKPQNILMRRNIAGDIQIKFGDNAAAFFASDLAIERRRYPRSFTPRYVDINTFRLLKKVSHQTNIAPTLPSKPSRFDEQNYLLLKKAYDDEEASQLKEKDRFGLKFEHYSSLLDVYALGITLIKIVNGVDPKFSEVSEFYLYRIYSMSNPPKELEAIYKSVDFSRFPRPLNEIVPRMVVGDPAARISFAEIFQLLDK